MGASQARQMKPAAKQSQGPKTVTAPPNVYTSRYLETLQADRTSYFSLLPADMVRYLDTHIQRTLKWSERAECYVAVNKFNCESPTIAIEWLKEQQLVANIPTQIAEFLFYAPHLDWVKLGEELGKKGNEDVLRCFVGHLNVVDLSLDDALRALLSRVRLPSEAQMIDRIIMIYAGHYTSSNPESIFSDAESVYILFFGLIMLSTDAHSPCVRNKLTKENYINGNRGVNKGGDFPRHVLEALYDAVVRGKPLFEPPALH